MYGTPRRARYREEAEEERPERGRRQGLFGKLRGGLAAGLAGTLYLAQLLLPKRGAEPDEEKKESVFADLQPVQYVAVADDYNIPHERGECYHYKNIEILENYLLGEGSYGATYATCVGDSDDEGDCDKYVAKVVQLGKYQRYEDFIFEAYLAYKAGEKGIGPKVYERFTCGPNYEKGVGVIIMDRLFGEKLDDVVITPKLWDKLYRQVNNMHNMGILHCDLYPRNIMLNAKGEPLIIDYGAAFLLDKNCAQFPVLALGEWFGLYSGEPRLRFRNRLEFENQGLQDKALRQIRELGAKLSQEEQATAEGYLTAKKAYLAFYRAVQICKAKLMHEEQIEPAIIER